VFFHLQSILERLLVHCRVDHPITSQLVGRTHDCLLIHFPCVLLDEHFQICPHLALLTHVLDVIQNSIAAGVEVGGLAVVDVHRNVSALGGRQGGLAEQGGIVLLEGWVGVLKWIEKG